MTANNCHIWSVHLAFIFNIEQCQRMCAPPFEYTTPSSPIPFSVPHHESLCWIRVSAQLGLIYSPSFTDQQRSRAPSRFIVLWRQSAQMCPWSPQFQQICQQPMKVSSLDQLLNPGAMVTKKRHWLWSGNKCKLLQCPVLVEEHLSLQWSLSEKFVNSRDLFYLRW